MKTPNLSIACVVALGLAAISTVTGSCAPSSLFKADSSTVSTRVRLVDAPVAKKASLPFTVYSDASSFDAAYIPSGYMGNTGAIKMDPACTQNPHGGANCLKVEYTAGNNWGGVVWQSPANDWGDVPGGWNISGAKQLSFWARGAKGGEKVSFLVGIIGPNKAYHDTALAKTDQVLTTTWTHYTIPLAGKDLSCIKTGFGWTLAGSGSSTTFYLDDIKYE